MLSNMRALRVGPQVDFKLLLSMLIVLYLPIEKVLTWLLFFICMLC